MKFSIEMKLQSKQHLGEVGGGGGSKSSPHSLLIGSFTWQ